MKVKLLMIRTLKVLCGLAVALFVVWCAGSLYFLLNGRDVDCLEEMVQSRVAVADGAIKALGEKGVLLLERHQVIWE